MEKLALLGSFAHLLLCLFVEGVIVRTQDSNLLEQNLVLLSQKVSSVLKLNYLVSRGPIGFFVTWPDNIRVVPVFFNYSEVLTLLGFQMVPKRVVFKHYQLAVLELGFEQEFACLELLLQL